MNNLPESNVSSVKDDGPRIRHDFIVTLSGYGRDKEGAFEDALKQIEDAAPYYDDDTVAPSDVAKEETVEAGPV